MNKRGAVSLLIVGVVAMVLSVFGGFVASPAGAKHKGDTPQTCYEEVPTYGDVIEKETHTRTRTRTRLSKRFRWGDWSNWSDYDDWADWPGAGSVNDDGRNRGPAFHGRGTDTSSNQKSQTEWYREYRYVVVGEYQNGTESVEVPCPTTTTTSTTTTTNEKPTTTSTTVAPKQISAKALCDHEIDNSEWHFVITQVDAEGNAPASIFVEWSNGNSANVPLDKFTGKVAHYATTANLVANVTSATATIYGGWGGQFNLSHGPACVTPTTTTTSTTTTTQPTTTTTEPTTTTTEPTTTTTTVPRGDGELIPKCQKVEGKYRWKAEISTAGTFRVKKGSNIKNLGFLGVGNKNFQTTFGGDNVKLQAQKSNGGWKTVDKANANTDPCTTTTTTTTEPTTTTSTTVPETTSTTVPETTSTTVPETTSTTVPETTTTVPTPTTTVPEITTTVPTTVVEKVFCTDLAALGIAPQLKGSPFYVDYLDPENDGISCGVPERKATELAYTGGLQSFLFGLGALMALIGGAILFFRRPKLA